MIDMNTVKSCVKPNSQRLTTSDIFQTKNGSLLKFSKKRRSSTAFGEQGGSDKDQVSA
jgi:hypothetical protein